jgi:hypothetical protein
LRVCARSEAHATVASDILLQLLPTCESREVELRGGDGTGRFPVSGLAFSHFLAQSRNLRVLDMNGLCLNTCHCRAIDALTRTDLQIQLFGCELTESGEEILLECIQQNRGPTKLCVCRIDTRRLAGALRGNNSVTTLTPHVRCSYEEIRILVQALAENEGLVKLDLRFCRITDPKFGLPCGNQLRATRNLRKFVLVLGEMGTRLRRRLSGCKPWWMRFA